MQRFNTDDTEEEMIFNGTYNPDRDVLLNCDNCRRTFHMYLPLAQARNDAGHKLLCLRCRKSERKGAE